MLYSEIIFRFDFGIIFLIKSNKPISLQNDFKTILDHFET